MGVKRDQAKVEGEIDQFSCILGTAYISAANEIGRWRFG